MKKLWSVLLCVAMISVLLVGCGKENKEATTAQEATAEGLTKENIKIGFIHIKDASDMGYTYNHDLGTQKLMEELGLNEDQIINKYNVPDGAECDTALRELVDAGCNVIFATSFGFEDYVIEVAKEYPDVQFCHATGYQAATSGLDNVHNYYALIYQARYTSGIAAGLKTETNKIGWVGAFSYAEDISGFTAFYLGAKSVNPDVTMEVKYSNTWADPKIEGEVAQSLIDSGCDVISQNTDSTAPATTAEKNGVWHIGYNTDMKEVAPEASIVAARVDWSVYLVETVEAVLAGEKLPVDWAKGYSADGSTDAVYLSPLNEAIAAEGTQEAIDEAIAGLRSGELQVFSGPLKGVGVDFDGNEITIDLKEGEYFIEQETVSAPSWAYVVEGVTVSE